MKYKHKCERCGQYKSQTYQKNLETEIVMLRDRIRYLEGKEFYMSIRKDLMDDLLKTKLKGDVRKNEI